MGEVGKLCRTQIEVVKRPGEVVQRRDLAGDAAPVTLHCPAAAKRLCRGFLRLSSRHRYQQGPAALPNPVAFRSPVRPAGVADAAHVGIAPGQSKVVCVPVDRGQRGPLRNTRPLEDPTPLDAGTGKRLLPFDLTISADEDGRSVVRYERYVISVTRPDQPIEYWGECSTLRIACRGTAGTRAADAISCAITAARRLKGDLKVTSGGGNVRYARGKATMDGRALEVRPKVTRTMRLGEQYQAVALLGYGGSARQFWTYFRARAR